MKHRGSFSVLSLKRFQSLAISPTGRESYIFVILVTRLIMSHRIVHFIVSPGRIQSEPVTSVILVKSVSEVCVKQVQIACKSISDDLLGAHLSTITQIVYKLKFGTYWLWGRSDVATLCYFLLKSHLGHKVFCGNLYLLFAHYKKRKSVNRRMLLIQKTTVPPDLLDLSKHLLDSVLCVYCRASFCICLCAHVWASFGNVHVCGCLLVINHHVGSWSVSLKLF